MAASMRLSRAVTLLLRRSDNFRRVPQPASSSLLAKCQTSNTNHSLNRFICTTQFLKNEQQTKGILIQFFLC
jgi:hypothetical protein